MGCDIHMQVEVRRDGKWERVEKLPPRSCSVRDGDHVGCYRCGGTGMETSPYCNRNYTVFSVLAGVRNDGNVAPICEPRGLPADATHATGVDEYGDERAEYEYGDHSFSWLTLDEVLAYPWKQEIRDEGFVDADTFAAWDKAGAKGPPVGTWCRSVGGGSVRHISNADMRRRIAKPYPWEANDRPYTLIQWTVPLTDYCKHFLAFVDSLAPLGEPNNIRLVFGFDS